MVKLLVGGGGGGGGSTQLLPITADLTKQKEKNRQ